MRRTTVWATALSALILGLATPNVSEAKPSGKAVASAEALTPISEFSAPTVESAGVQPVAPTVDETTLNAITKTYQFGERSTRVKELQSVLGVKVDGFYGPQTRKAHIKTLKRNGLATKHVPKVTKIVALGARYPQDPEMRCPKWEDEFIEYGLPVDVFSYIAWRESRCNPKATNARWNSKGQMTYTLNSNGTYDSGLLQINSGWLRTVRDVCNVNTGSARKDLEELLKVDCNLKMAKWIMENTSGKLRNWSIYGAK